MADSDRAYVGQYSEQDVGIVITDAGAPVDPTGNAVAATVSNTDTQQVLISDRDATRIEAGRYQIELSLDDTSVLGNYQIVWNYLLNGQVRTYVNYFAVGGAQPAYDVLPDDMKAIVDSVWIRMADLFDSPSGGPNLQTWRQANFNRGRVAQLLKPALGRINTKAQPVSTYSVDGSTGSRFPTERWGALLEKMLWIETIKHLRRSYLEQPMFDGGGISRLDRQAYFDRWGAILTEEEEDAQDQLSNFKISMMFLGQPAVLVSGGVFPKIGTFFQPQMAARTPLLFSHVF